jgi:hypothetical protein
VPLNSVERGEMTSRAYPNYGASGVIDQVDDYLFDDELLLIAEEGANLVLRNLPLAIIAKGKFWVNNHAHILKPRHGNIVYPAQLWRMSTRYRLRGFGSLREPNDASSSMAAPRDQPQAFALEHLWHPALIPVAPLNPHQEWLPRPREK